MMLLLKKKSNISKLFYFCTLETHLSSNPQNKLMNRSSYFDYIEEKLNLLAVRIQSKGKLNILDLHIHSENFYPYFLNRLYGWQLSNMNLFKQNVEGIDLIDETNQLIIQISATNTKQKVENSLNKIIFKQYSKYTFKFISIAYDSDNLRNMTFENPYNILFNPKIDIIDKKSILNNVLALDIDNQKNIFHFVQKELGNEVDFTKLDSNMATIINILAKENLSDIISTNNFHFSIDDKISYNQLVKTKPIIMDYVIHHIQLDEKYKQFDVLGLNKSRSVLQSIRRMYFEAKTEADNADKIFSLVIDKLIQKVRNSANFVQIPIEELDLCANIVAVDAFIRCKIFENPENYRFSHATSR
jgi:hypothetical protein